MWPNSYSGMSTHILQSRNIAPTTQIPIKYGQDNQATDPIDTSPKLQTNSMKQTKNTFNNLSEASFTMHALLIPPSSRHYQLSLANKLCLLKTRTTAYINSLTTWPHIPMPKYNIVLPTWYSMCNQMPCISVHLTREVTQVATSSLAVTLVMDLQFKSMVLCMSHAHISNWWRYQRLKQSLAQSFSMHKRPKSSDLSLKNLVIHNHQLPYTVTAPLRLALLTTPSNNNIHELLKWGISGSLMVKHNDSFDSIINPDKRTWETTLPNITQLSFVNIRPYYVHMHNSPTFLPWAAKPSSWQGCVETLADPYKGRIPLPSVPTYQEQDLSRHLIRTGNNTTPNGQDTFPNGERMKLSYPTIVKE